MNILGLNQLEVPFFFLYLSILLNLNTIDEIDRWIYSLID